MDSQCGGAAGPDLQRYRGALVEDKPAEGAAIALLGLRLAGTGLTVEQLSNRRFFAARSGPESDLPWSESG